MSEDRKFERLRKRVERARDLEEEKRVRALRSHKPNPDSFLEFEAFVARLRRDMYNDFLGFINEVGSK